MSENSEKTVLDKLDFVQKLEGLTEKNKYKSQINDICDLLKIIPNDVEIKDLPSLKSFMDNSPSRLDDPEQQLQDIHKELSRWIGKNPASTERVVIECMNGRTRTLLSIFLALIITLAAAAVACTIAHILLGDAGFPMGDSIAEGIGTCDFTLGVVAFVVERFDDMNKNIRTKDLHAAAEKVKAGEDSDKFIGKCIHIYKEYNFNIGNTYIYGDAHFYGKRYKK